MNTIRHVTDADTDGWLELRLGLWPDASRSSHLRDIKRFLAGISAEPQAVLVAQTEDEQLIGFVELSTRAYAEGCDSDSVAYLEGWFVTPTLRGTGVGKALVDAAEAWGRDRGCREFASDAEATNQASIDAHHAVGFEDTGLIRCFKKAL